MADQQTGRRVIGRFAGVTPTNSPLPNPPPQPIPEAKWRAVIASLVTDLIRGKAQRAAVEQARFPVRAEWLRAELAKRKWNKHDLERYGGPHHKTTQKVLDGRLVQDGVLQKIALGLSAGERGAKVILTKIPQT